MKIKIFKRVIRYTFDKSQKDQQKAWQLLDQLDPFYKEPLYLNKLIKLAPCLNESEDAQ